MYVTAASPAGFHVNTQLPNKVKKGTGIARKTGNNKLTTSKHTKKITALTAKSVSTIHPPLPPAFDSWTPNNPPADSSRPGLCTHASLDGAPRGF